MPDMINSIHDRLRTGASLFDPTKENNSMSPATADVSRGYLQRSNTAASSSATPGGQNTTTATTPAPLESSPTFMSSIIASQTHSMPYGFHFSASDTKIEIISADRRGIELYLEDSVLSLCRLLQQERVLSQHLVSSPKSPWLFAIIFQASYLGQLVRTCEYVHQCFMHDLLQSKDPKANTTFSSFHNSRDPALWENLFRGDINDFNLTSRSLSYSSSPILQVRQEQMYNNWLRIYSFHDNLFVPFGLHYLSPSSISAHDSLFYSSSTAYLDCFLYRSLPQVYHILQVYNQTNRLSKCLSLSIECKVSDWSLWLVFVEDVSIQIQEFFQLVYPSHQSLLEIEETMQSFWQASHCALFLQSMHVIGKPLLSSNPLPIFADYVNLTGNEYLISFRYLLGSFIAYWYGGVRYLPPRSLSG